MDKNADLKQMQEVLLMSTKATVNIIPGKLLFDRGDTVVCPSKLWQSSY